MIFFTVNGCISKCFVSIGKTTEGDPLASQFRLRRIYEALGYRKENLVTSGGRYPRTSIVIFNEHVASAEMKTKINLLVREGRCLLRKIFSSQNLCYVCYPDDIIIIIIILKQEYSHLFIFKLTLSQTGNFPCYYRQSQSTSTVIFKRNGVCL